MYGILFVFFTIMLLFFLIIISDFARIACQSGKVHFICLVIIIIAGGILRFYFVPHKFRVFYDEYQLYTSSITIQETKNVLWCVEGSRSRCEKWDMPFQMQGFPFTGAMFFRLFSSNDKELLFKMNALIGALSILVIYVLVFHLFGQPAAGIWTAVFTALMPAHILLSANASFEMLSFLVICMLLISVIKYLNTGSIFMLVFFFLLSTWSILVRADNAVAFIFLLLVVFSRRDFKAGEWKVVMASVTFMGIVLVPFFPILSKHIGVYENYVGGALTTHGASLVLGNIQFLLSNPFIPSVFLLFSLLGFLTRKDGNNHRRWLISFSFLIFIVLNIIQMELWKADFFRRMLVMTIPILIFCGMGTVEILSRTEGLKQNIVFSSLIVILLCSNLGWTVRLQSPPEDVDKFFAEYIPRINQECSIFAMNTSVAMTYVNNRVYGIEKLLDSSFTEEHAECKVVIRDIWLLRDRELNEKIEKLYDLKLMDAYIVSNYYTPEILMIR